MADTPQSVNDELYDAMVRHQIFLLRFAKLLTSRYVGDLNATEARMREIILDTGKIQPARTPRNIERTNKLIERLFGVRRPAWAEISPNWRGEMNDLVPSQSDFMMATYTTASPVVLGLVAPLLTGIVAKSSFQGRTLTGWLRNLETTDLGLISGAVQTAVSQDSTPRAMAQLLTGTKAQRGRNGFTQRTRNNVQSIVRTSTEAFTALVNRRFTLANPTIFSWEQYVAVLDGRTTPICRSLDGRLFPPGEGYIPPIHIGCRSLRQPLIDGQKVGNRTATPLYTRRVLSDYSKANRISPIARTRAALPHGHKGRFDAFRRKQAFQVIGPNEPTTISYGDWLGRQSAQFQDDVLGRTKGLLFRKGGLSLDRFVDSTGRENTIFQMAQNDAAAFRRAGLDPDDPLWKSYISSADPTN